jgi:signal transduction histidine kinase
MRRLTGRRLGARHRGAFVALLLFGAILVAALLAVQAQVAVTYHRATAERVLGDYSQYAAARLAMRLGQTLWFYAFVPTLDAVRRGVAKGGGALPDPRTLVPADTEALTREFVHRTLATYRYDFRTRHLESRGHIPDQVAAWAVDTLRLIAESRLPKEWRMGGVIGVGPARGHVILYTFDRAPDGAVITATGTDVAADAIMPFVRFTVESAPLLPPSLTHGVVYDSMGSVRVVDGAGGELYRTAVQYQSDFAARDTVDVMAGRMRVEIALRPEMAGKLVIGGLPRSRLPLTLGLLFLTAGLIAAALFQLRREYELSRLRSDFVSSVSHELRTPLAQIRMFSETLLLDRVRSDEERQRSVEIMDQEARRLTHLVENLLHFSRTERRITEIHPAPTPLAPLVCEVVENFAPIAAARHMRITAPENGSMVAPVDADALRQMLINLLDNAVKYGPEGQRIAVTLATENGSARVLVDDEGPGVPQGDRERIWERFWRLQRDRGSAVAGTGIGLAVVRELAELHGGRAWVEDAPTGGARFVIEVPV